MIAARQEYFHQVLGRLLYVCIDGRNPSFHGQNDGRCTCMRCVSVNGFHQSNSIATELQCGKQVQFPGNEAAAFNKLLTTVQELQLLQAAEISAA